MQRGQETGLMVAGGVLLALGSLLIGVGFVWPLARVIDARGWTATPCELVSCELTSTQRSSGRNRRTWRVHARYRYAVDGRAYTGERFELGPWTGGGFDWRQEAIARLGASDPPRCWVDPDDPSRAVLERGFDPHHCVALIGLIPLAGGAALAAYVRRARRERVRRQREGDYRFPSAEPTPVPPPDGAERMPVVSRMVEDPVGLEAPRRMRQGPTPPAAARRRLSAHRPGPWAAIAWLIAFTAAYAVVLHPLCSLFAGRLSDGWAWLAYAPPAGIAAILVAHAALRIAAARAPSAMLGIEPLTVWPGATATVRWDLPAETRVGRLIIDLVGEEVLLHRGSGARREIRGFQPIPLAEVGAPSPSGAVRVTVPASIMPSFSGDYVQVRWSLAVRLDIPQAADGLDRYAIDIHPAPPEAP